jgi:hypothetical protein
MFKINYLLFLFLLFAGALNADGLKEPDGNCYCGLHKKVTQEIRKRFFSEEGKKKGKKICGLPGCLKIHPVDGTTSLGCETSVCCGLLAKNTSYHAPSSSCRCSVLACFACSCGKNDDWRFSGCSFFGAGIITAINKAALSCFPSWCCTSEQCCDVMKDCGTCLGACCGGFCKCVQVCAEACEDMDCDDDCGDAD